MSIFKHSSDTAQQTREAATATRTPGGQAAQATMPMPPFAGTPPRGTAAPGVVPPPAAPMYSMRAPDLPPHVDTASSAASGNGKAASDAQQSTPASVPQPVPAAAPRPRTAPARNAVARPARQMVPVTPAAAPPRRTFDPIGAAQAGLLSLAWSWQNAGAPIRAIHAYMELIERYPDSPAAAGAIADLVDLSSKLAEEGNFHTAFRIYDELERLHGCVET